MGRRSLVKGKRGEREAAAELERLFGAPARRGRQYQGGPDSPDVVVDIPGLHVEVKRTEALRLYSALQQATCDADGQLPLVLHRANHQPWVAIVRLDDLPAIVVKLYLTLMENA